MRRITGSDGDLEQRVEAEVAKWQLRMGLSDWQVFVKIVDPEPGAPDFYAAIDRYSQISVFGENLWAELRVNRQHPPPMEQLQWIVVHELCHLLLHPFVEWTASVLHTECFSPDYAAGWLRNHTIKEEQMVQKLCEAIIGTRQPWLAGDED